jgi:DNA-binding XRE family transcriptional regulator
LGYFSNLNRGGNHIPRLKMQPFEKSIISVHHPVLDGSSARPCSLSRCAPGPRKHPRRVALPFCHVTLRGQKPARPGYSRSLKTIGDHIKKRRMDLKLTQRELAEKLSVDKTIIQCWEDTRVRPSLAKIVKIIEFLGYHPCEHKAESLADKLKAFR